jgi:adenylate kinase
MGDIVRREIGSGSAQGETLRQYNDRGELVPDDTILELASPILRANDNWILDGFPRDLAQARALDTFLQNGRLPLDRVVALDIPEESLIERLAGRRQSASTGETYHLVHNPPPAGDIGPFIQRADDEPAGIQRRLELYHSMTEPLKQHYDQQGLLTHVDANGSIDEVRDRVFAALGL